jgi:hypothetical protein
MQMFEQAFQVTPPTSLPTMPPLCVIVDSTSLFCSTYTAGESLILLMAVEAG